MSVNVCPCCHRPLISAFEQVADEASLSMKERELFLTVANGFGGSVLREVVVNALYGLDPNGGPDDPRAVIAVIMTKTNAKIAPFGYRIFSRKTVGYRLATIIPTEAAA
ncbi:hypothetical protein VW35_00950 [Devosia soli]|uniref:OmpR/PhoB-type domain-containing protein n=1 Tax=Devosia soli TaxID=361041 RepID=A0A0F5LF37_9HYPH|nr:hypothetical protein [Devosia soli]KKB80809.1 hypothetical protein VW35_00950 [Devosia soli]